MALVTIYCVFRAHPYQNKSAIIILEIVGRKNNASVSLMRKLGLKGLNRNMIFVGPWETQRISEKQPVCHLIPERSSPFVRHL